MVNFLIGLFLGLFLGGFFGILVMILFIVAKKSDESTPQISKNNRENIKL